MPIAEFIRTETIDKTDQTKSVAVVSIDGIEKKIGFWYSIIGQYSKEDIRLLLCAEALFESGLIEESRNIIVPGAAGSLDKDENGGYIDTRNWRQNWLDAHPLPPEIITPDNDPLL